MVIKRIKQNNIDVTKNYYSNDIDDNNDKKIIIKTKVVRRLPQAFLMVKDPIQESK